ncbi:hypothetical protein AVEN_61451-1 [Araneus ventricosus]|uniref:Uncharacterized protein n=1 Tax=Araneus ventricosus TaxID=182803 RepID=A0A4Y2KF48_ARAVE|nr:hypothetical protein AVEN_257802-1 [Araneus ventricosus]GBN00542.1 hypothetical protein AVEN_61451-1 [Araneus ventricosus]
MLTLDQSPSVFSINGLRDPWLMEEKYKPRFDWTMYELRRGLEGGGGLIIAGESSKSSEMSYSKVSSSAAEEELISASASDSRDCNILFFQWRENSHW